ncbi:spore coat protein U domain-containing protein [Undibacterium sp. CY18W]|uniref:Spore coat protein U domain-containing protein n=1 Tax=Undibacterium hunanense TaxID=2762292 RepID=A0ABR6ZR82_9BURK|nr:spore coat U domain-containing protein [Undibacterium hunanense]MBC3918406.1 spore coat protein U domain-containing protein [Undibacterium hunanense]
MLSALLVILTPALAENRTASLAVSAVVVPTCTVQGSAISFGNYETTPVEQTSNIGVNCSQGTAYVVSLGGANANVRQMAGPSNATLNYALFQDASRSKLWGSAVDSNAVAGTGNGNLQNLPVYGRIPAGQVVTPGNYNEAVSITLTY